MELKVKSGHGLRCGYTGAESNVLVKICVERDGQPDLQSEWLCRDAIEQALRVMDAVERRPVQASRTALVTQPEAALESDEPDLLTEIGGAAPAARPKSGVSAAHAALVGIFQDACQELSDNPPTDQNGNAKLSELHIRELIAKYKARIPADLLFRCVNDVFGMTKERFNVSIGKF